MNSAETRNCKACDTGFSIDSEDFSFYEKMGVPAPILCPGCRFRRRALWRNERTLYKRSCDLCERSIISMYHPESDYVVYCYECWYSDKWSAFDYALDYDPARPFFDQLGELTRRVPKCASVISVAMGVNINSEYTNFAGANKDCYLAFNSGPNNENCGYSRGLQSCRDVFDVYFSESSERSYEMVNIQRSAGIVFGQNVIDCLDSWFLMDCVASQNCFGCVNLRHGSYQFFNQQLSKEEWTEKVKNLQGSYKEWQKARKEFESHALTFPKRENSSLKCEDCTGDYLYECKNCKECYEVSGSENVRYSFSIKDAKDCYDILGHGRRGELLLECAAVGVSQKMIGCWWAETSHDLEYCLAISGSDNCIGCDGLNKGSYCILNKRYEPEEYFRLREKIVKELTDSGDYGLFLPISLAPFAYNESIADDNLPLSKEEALGFGFRWQDDIPETRGQETLKSEDIPDRIQDVDDGILKETLACDSCGRNYRLIKPELEMYRRALVPIPRTCFNCRHLDRLERRGSFSLHVRSCDKCGIEINTTYPPDGPEIVYCEKCYQAEVI